MLRIMDYAANVIQRFCLKHYYNDLIETYSNTIQSALFWREYLNCREYIPKRTIVLTCECGNWGFYEDIQRDRHDFWNGLCFECEKTA